MIADVSAQLSIDIYGYRVNIRSGSAEALRGLQEDFAYFRSDAAGEALSIELFHQAPPYDTVPPVNASVYTPRNVSYRHGNLVYIDYSGRALGVHDTKSGAFRIYSCDAELLYEATYLFLLSQCGEVMDARRFHRVHALGVSVNGAGALVLLPMGGGKSTLGSRLLAYTDVQLLSDDSPLIDAAGTIHAFPLRLGLLPGAETGIPESQIRRINRMEFGPKLLVNYSYFEKRVRAQAEPAVIFLGRRNLGENCTITPASRGECLRALFVNCVVGLGLFQGMEFVFQRGFREVGKKGMVAWARLRASLRLIRRSDSHHLNLGRDLEENARVVHEFLQAHAARNRVN